MAKPDTGDFRAILHIGAPKCGSSALQTALSNAPVQTGADGRRYVYTAQRSVKGQRVVQKGRILRDFARASAYGYVSWPNLKRGENPVPFFKPLHEVLDPAACRDGVPILSCEGWISYPGVFGTQYDFSRGAPTEVVAFVRPPLEWLNAAYWQWGVWHGWSFDFWLSRANMGYTLGSLLQRWKAIEGTRLRVHSARQDVVAAFAGAYGLPLTGGMQTNSSSPASLIGFMLRNRQFRNDPHNSAAEFVFQRWCPPLDEPRAWAIEARHVLLLRGLVRPEVDRLLETVSDAEREALLEDPRWQREKPYHPVIEAGPSRLDDRTHLAGLHGSLVAGVQAVCAALRQRPPAPPPCPAESASLEDWDAALVPLMETLISRDADLRRKRTPALVELARRMIDR